MRHHLGALGRPAQLQAVLAIPLGECQEPVGRRDEPLDTLGKLSEIPRRPLVQCAEPDPVCLIPEPFAFARRRFQIRRASSKGLQLGDARIVVDRSG
jgi:hypothetical protein